MKTAPRHIFLALSWVGLLCAAAPLLRTLETLRVLFRMIEEKHQLVDLLSRSIAASARSRSR